MKIFKTEIKKAFDTPGFIIALIIGFLCVFYKNFETIKHDILINKMIISAEGYVEVIKEPFYNIWVIGNIGATTLYLFYFLGIIAALPYGISYFRDKKTGIIKNICTRCDKKKYLMSKYMAVFIVGGTASAFPIFLDLLMAKLYYPYHIMRIEMSGISGSTEWNMFIIDHPYISAGIYIAIWFLFGGALGSISLMISVIADNLFTIQLTPFFVMLALFYIPNNLPSKYNKYFPYYFLTTLGDAELWIPIAVSLLILGITFATFMLVENRRDIL